MTGLTGIMCCVFSEVRTGRPEERTLCFLRRRWVLIGGCPFTVIPGFGNSPQIERQILPVLTRKKHCADGSYCNQPSILL
jgi:hypothetical protein